MILAAEGLFEMDWENLICKCSCWVQKKKKKKLVEILDEERKKKIKRKYSTMIRKLIIHVEIMFHPLGSSWTMLLKKKETKIVRYIFSFCWVE